ncbi:hypothetical protein CY35_17G066900 [Sphagnum magellanicum]|nr:hypothetical protein CY35_17G066900 [Sphagnum magellanicum]
MAGGYDSINCMSEAGAGGTEQITFQFDLCTARAATAWELSQRALACSLLGRARSLLSILPGRHQELAEQYLQFGQSLLAKDDVESQAESVKYIEFGLDICSEALSSSSSSDLDAAAEKTSLERLNVRILRHLTAAHLQNGNLESVLKCAAALRVRSDHPTTSYFALRAFAGLHRYDEVAKEIFTLLSHSGASFDVCLSALEIVIQDCWLLEVVEKAFFLLFSRFPTKKELPACVLAKLLTHDAAPSPSLITRRIELALRIASDERVITTITAGVSSTHARGGGGGLLSPPETRAQPSAQGAERQCIHALLWNSGSEYFQGKDYETSIKLFEASMLYLLDGSNDGNNTMQRAKSLRVLCLCHLALMQFDRAAEVLQQAEKTNHEEEANQQLEQMMACCDFEPEYLTLAAHEAIASNSNSTAVAALSRTLSLIASGRDVGTKEVVVLRNLINLILSTQEGSLVSQEEVLKYLKQAQSHISEQGYAGFFGAGSMGERETTWFAGVCWNQALAAARCQDWKHCFQFHAMSSELYASLPETAENLGKIRTSLLLCVAALLAIDSSTDHASESLKVASAYMEKCRKVHGSLSSRSDTAMLGSSDESESFEVHLNTVAFDLKGRVKDYKAQLEILMRCSSIPGFKSEHFFKMGLSACKAVTPSSVEVAIAAFRTCLHLTLSTATPDYKVVAVTVRKLIILADLQCKDGPEALSLYRQANQILLGLSSHDKYPRNEAQWLFTSAWNRARIHVKFLRFSEAEEWMGMGLELLKHVPSLELHRAAMMESLSALLKEKAERIML